MTNTDTIVTFAYIIIQVSVAVFVSIAGAIHVRRCIDKSNSDNLWKSWIKTVWKMKNVYGALAVHCFDVLTDVLVILEWLKLKNVDGDHINPQIMAYSAIFVMLFSKVISTMAIYIKDADIIRCILQIFDLLIFQEIYESHRKIVCRMKSKKLKDKNETIESTLSFKYIRNCEAVFESIPQSMLQLVYVTRTSNVGVLFIVSILQSIISMTNSILNNDYTQMQDDKFSKVKQRLPPTFECFKHALCRLCEVTYRIGLLALIWTVCGGLAFIIILFIDFVIILLRFSALIREVDEVQFDADSVLLNINSIIVIPTEYVYAFGRRKWRNHFRDGIGDTVSKAEEGSYMFLIMLLDCCCMSCCSFFAALSGILCIGSGEVTFIPLTRICTSFVQIAFLVLYSFGKPDRKKFLFEADHGLYVFIVTCVCYLIYTQYMVLFPDFALPFGVSVRSKWGYALANELSELEKIKVPSNKMPYTNSKLMKYKITDEATFWDEPYQYQDGKALTAAVIASAKGHDNVIKYLEASGAKYHKYVDIEDFKIPQGLTGKFAAALSGDRSGLKKAIGEYRGIMKTKWINLETERKIQTWWRSLDKKKFSEEQTQRIKIKEQLEMGWDYNYSKCDWNKVSYKANLYDINIEADFWDEPAAYFRDNRITPAVFALAQENSDIVEWLEEKGAVKHSHITQEIAKELVFNK
eukprot:263821_1